MQRIVHLSDIHNSPLFVRIVKFIIKRYGADIIKPVIVITGDLTDNGGLGEYVFVSEQINLLKRKGFTVLCVIGNHDECIAGNIFDASARQRWEKFISPGPYPQHHRINGMTFLLVDSCIGNHAETFRFASGEIGKPQLDRLNDEIEKSERPIIVSLHHHPQNRGLTDYFMELDDAMAFWECIKGRVDLLLFGHRHVADVIDDPRVSTVIASGKSTDTDTHGRLWMREITIREDGGIDLAIVSI